MVSLRPFHLTLGLACLPSIVQYAETPQYLRKQLFPMHPSLRLAGLLNPLDAPHHMRADDLCPFREGVVLDRTIKKGAGSFVDIGKRKVWVGCFACCLGRWRCFCAW